MTMEGGTAPANVVDFEAWRTSLLADQSVRPEDKVEINQRHLIDKILARYSAEYTIYREVLQNANDAGATTVEIIFGEASLPKQQDSTVSKDPSTINTSSPSPSSTHSHPINTITIRNNGRPFDAADWGRLKRIAEGNPDEQKIGFFGVGFYSLFSICDAPLVLSDRKSLAFYWCGDQLYARAGTVPDSYDTFWTSIFLTLREPLQRPNLDAFAHFLAKSILFTASLDSISVLEEGRKQHGQHQQHQHDQEHRLLFHLKSTRSTPTDLPFAPASLLSSTLSSPARLFSMGSVKVRATRLELDKRYASADQPSSSTSTSLLSTLWSFARNLAKDRQQLAEEVASRQPGVFSLFLHIVECDLKVTAERRLATAMERITKKAPPATTRLSLIYSTFDELEACRTEGAISPSKHPVLKGVLPDPGAGRVFIGFETYQTTGCAVHINAQFIPTVERESIDFVDQTLATWNGEIFQIAAKLIRVLYEAEALTLNRLFPPSTDPPPDAAYWERAAHLLRTFGIKESSPIRSPALILHQEFFTCSAKSPSFPSSIGVVPLIELRSVPLEVQAFCQAVPQVKREPLTNADFFLHSLERFQIQEASIAEISKSIKTHQPTDQGLISCLKWLIRTSREGRISTRELSSITTHLMVPVGDEEEGGKRASLASLTFYPGHAFLEEQQPLPTNCLSLKISSALNPADLTGVFHLRELSLVDWVSFYLTLPQAQIDKEFAENALTFLASHFYALSSADKTTIRTLLSTKTIIPTCLGMRRPKDAYLDSVKVFGELATVNLSPKTRLRIQEDFLIQLGVQSHIDVAQIFASLDQLEWDHRQLVKYLAKVEAQLATNELELLRNARLFPAINRPGKFLLSELYIDHPVIRLLQLPILNWKHNNAPSLYSDSMPLLGRLGLNMYVPLSTLLESVSLASAEDRTKLLRYFIDNFRLHYQTAYLPKKIPIPFIPLDDASERVVRPTECFLDDPLKILNFQIAHRELQPYAAIFGIASHPTIDVLMEGLKERKFDPKKAAELYGYLSSILHEFTPRILQELSSCAIVPVLLKGKEEALFKWFQPRQLFFSSGPYQLGALLQTIDFGPQARPFLHACGVNNEPTPLSVARMIASDGRGVLEVVGTDKYVDLLRWIALSIDSIHQADVLLLDNLAKACCLLGIEYSTTTTPDTKEPEQDILSAKYVLASSAQIFLIDDTISHQIFHILAAPNDAKIELLYQRLGCKWLSRVVQQNWRFVGAQSVGKASRSLQALIKYRAPLLLAEPSTLGTCAKDALARLTHLQVLQVHEIIIHRQLSGRSHDQPTTASLDGHGRLLITQDFDYFDVAWSLTRVIFKGHSRLPDALLVSTLLTTPLPSLRLKGFPVDRLLGESPGGEGGKVKDQVAKTLDIPLAETIPPTSTSKGQTIVQPEKSMTNSKSPIPSKADSSEKGQFEEDIPEEALLRSALQNEREERHHGSSISPRRSSGLLGALKNVLRDATRRQSSSRTPSSNTTQPVAASEHNREMKQVLQRAISDLQTHDRADIEYGTQMAPIPTKLADSYCQVLPGQALRFAGVVEHLQVYTSIRITQPAAAIWLAENQETLCSFAALLSRLASLFGIIDPRLLHIFYDPESPSIAFNRDRALFFNLAQYHAQLQGSCESKLILASWYMTFCHELAHSFIGPHDERHEFYMSAFAEQYMGVFVALFNT